MKLPKTWPKVVRRGHSVVKVYRTPSNGCEQFTLVYYLGEKRIRKALADYGRALTEAETIATKLSQGELNVVELTGQDRLAYVRAVEAIKPTGVPLEMAAIHFAEACLIAGGAKQVVDAAHYYAKHHPRNLPQKTVAEVIEELLEAKEADRVSDMYVRDLRRRLGRFQEAYPTKIGLITTADVERFVRGVKAQVKLADGSIGYRPASPKLRNHYRGGIGTLFYFAEARGYIPKGMVDIEAVAVAKRTGGAIEIFQVDEMERMLAAAHEGLVPFLAIGGFAGLRHAEIQRLDWSEVRLNDGFIEVKAEKAKTASRRLVPITPNLKEWLLPHRKQHGPVTAYVNMSNELTWLAGEVDRRWKEEEAKKTADGGQRSDGRGQRAEGERWFKWKHNALRHSFISYRVAEVQNVAQVALEAGNSPQMIFKNYRELVRPAEAKAWFAIVPGAGKQMTDSGRQSAVKKGGDR